jgi:hypothetical protein
MPSKVFGWFVLIVVLTSVIFMTNFAYAEDSRSTHYLLDEPSIGSDSTLDSSSNSYQVMNATGDLVVGDSSSSNYNVSAGSVTTKDPTLSFLITSGASNFGSFSTANPTITTTNFSVINYTSWGYVVQIIGSPPKYGSHTITPMDETESSIAGTEQFGINLVANTTPSNFGANPDNGNFGFGAAATNYNVSNKFRYVSGETIAMAPKSSGKTDYTISYLVNVNSLTPGGQYTSDQTIIVTGTY